MTTLTQLKNWLKTPNHIRRILVEVSGVYNPSGGSTATYYFSNGAYTSSPSDTPANTSYLPYIIGGVSFAENFSIDGSFSVSYGDIELLNYDGKNDNYLNLIWTKKEINIYLGDPSWSKSDFKLIFKGMVADLISRDRSVLNLVLTDKLQALGTSISEATFTTNETTTPELIPLTFGECFNVTPKLVNKTTLEYQVHTGLIEDIIEVRDNGLPVEITKDLTNGKFRLNQSSYGQITCSVQGDKGSGTYYNTIAQLIKRIVTGFGPTANRLSASDLSSTFTNFDSTTSREIGIYISDRQNILEICNQIANSANTKLMFTVGPLANDSDVGKLQLIKLQTPISGGYEITGSDIEENSINIIDKTQPKAAIKLAFCKNWTVQASGLANGIPAEHLDFYKYEWIYNTDNTDGTVKTTYSLTSEVAQEDTLLITSTSALAEANQRLNLFKQSRITYTMTGYPHLFDLQLGDFVSLTNRRFNLSNTPGIVVSIARDWLRGRVDIGVLV